VAPPRDRFPTLSDALKGKAWTQAPLTFAPDGSTRNETKLLHALTRALAELAKSGDPEAALRETFKDAMDGLGAAKGVLVQVREETPPEIEVLCAVGLSQEEEASCRSLQSCPGISPTVIRNAIEQRDTTLIQDSSGMGPEGTLSLRVRPFSVMCAPVSDSLTDSVAAVLYFQNEARSPFTTEDLGFLAGYAGALGQMLTLHLSRQRRIQVLEAEWRRGQDLGPEMVGESEAMKGLMAQLNELLLSTGRPDAPVILVCGETGTGKELVARYLHHYSPKRSRGPFHAFNCASLRGDLVEIRLFGHKKGSFTGAIGESMGLFCAANTGTLFLDEIGEMPLECQAMLLRVIETRRVQRVGEETKETPVDVQIILATNRDLRAAVAKGTFREDLYYRIKGLRVDLMPLRDPTRIADLRTLIAFHLAKQERALNKKTQGLTRAAFRSLLQYAWPGNVRELNNVCMCLVTHVPAGAWIDVADVERLCPEIFTGPKNRSPEVVLQDPMATYAELLEAFRKQVVRDRIAQCGGGAAAAKSLGLAESTVYRYLSDDPHKK
jgi:transcriptional regulator with GAF, ATPase, and Fis domain